jgi:hypothetical protein
MKKETFLCWQNSLEFCLWVVLFRVFLQNHENPLSSLFFYYFYALLSSYGFPSFIKMLCNGSKVFYFFILQRTDMKL